MLSIAGGIIQIVAVTLLWLLLTWSACLIR